MAFMTPQYANVPFVRITKPNGESELCLAQYAMPEPDEEVELCEIGKWFCQLSADGFMDQTSWDGPYDTLEQAKTAIIDTWDVDPDTGDELTDVA